MWRGGSHNDVYKGKMWIFSPKIFLRFFQSFDEDVFFNTRASGLKYSQIWSNLGQIWVNFGQKWLFLKFPKSENGRVQKYEARLLHFQWSVLLYDSV